MASLQRHGLTAACLVRSVRTDLRAEISKPECLKKDKEGLLTFNDFPTEHRTHMRTINPLESNPGLRRCGHEMQRIHGCVSRTSILSMVLKLARSAEQRWQLLPGCELLTESYRRRSVQNQCPYRNRRLSKVAA